MEETAKRPWRLHRSTCAAAFFGMGFALLLLVPGDSVEELYAHRFAAGTFVEEEFEHGWPWTYLRRKVEYIPTTPLYRQFASPVLCSDCWRFAGKREFQPSILFADLLVLLTSVVVLATAVEWRRRRRTRFSQMTIVEILAGVAILAGAIAWWRSMSDGIVRERQVAKELQAELSGTSFSLRYCGPRWLSRLRGSKNLPSLHGVDELWLEGYPDSEVDLPDVTNLKHLSTLVLSCRDSATECAALRLFANSSTIRVVGFQNSLSAEALTLLGTLRNLRQLDIKTAEANAAAIVNWPWLQSLESLYLSAPNMTDDCIAVIAQLPKLRSLHIEETL